MGLKDLFKTLKEKGERAQFKIKYENKLKSLGFDDELFQVLIERRDDEEVQAIAELALNATNKETFRQALNDRIRNQRYNVYAGSLLIGNLTGNYHFMDFYTTDVQKNLTAVAQNSSPFTSENADLLQVLREHFPEYVINNNARKNNFAKMVSFGKESVRDLSADVDEEQLLGEYDRVLSGRDKGDNVFKRKNVMDYVLTVIGNYTREDIMERFDFVLYDMEHEKSGNLDERRSNYLQQVGLSPAQRDKIAGVGFLSQRLEHIGDEQARELLDRIKNIQGQYANQIDELEDIYLDYEIMFRQRMVDRLFVPDEDVTVIKDYKDVRPQLIHSFIRSMEKFRGSLTEDLKKKIIAERQNGSDSNELTSEEQERFNKMLAGLEAQINPYIINQTASATNMVYSDQYGFSYYKSDTSNQISGSILTLEDFLHTNQNRILGVGFNSETLSPEAIAISSNQYKTTNKGVYNIEDTEGNEFEQTSAPLQELEGVAKTEVVMHRRGEDYDTKASYLFAIVNSTFDKEAAEQVKEQAIEIGQKEGLKVVIYDTGEIQKSYEQDKNHQREENER